MSVSFWLTSYLAIPYDTEVFYNKSVLVSGALFLFNVFIITLRPLTLTLRVFINVRLGHFIILLIYKVRLFISLLLLLEIFVYVVQSFVFMTLVVSYLESL